MANVTRGSTLEKEQTDHLAGNQVFFPSPEDFGDHFGVSLNDFQGSKKVLISLDLLRLLIGLAAAGSSYDPIYYKEKYHDLREAHDDGEIDDLRAHYVNQGYFEKRSGCRAQAFPVDENWYLTSYPDVAAGIKAGTIDSASDHYLTTGRKEGRLPSGDVPAAIKQLIAALRAN